MLNIDKIYFIVGGSIVLFIFILLNTVLAIFLFKIRSKISLLFGSKKIKNLEEIFSNSLIKSKKQEAEIVKILSRLNKLENTAEITFQKMGMIRFNPFSDMGGNQSFVIALLDNQNNGFVISNLFIKESSRVYAKAIRNGKSDFSLSKEEQEALERAMNSEKKT